MRSRSFQVCIFCLYKKGRQVQRWLQITCHYTWLPSPSPKDQPARILTDWPPATTDASAGMRSFPVLGCLFLLFTWAEARRHHPHHRPQCFSSEDVPVGQVPVEFLSRARRWDRHSAVQLVPILEKESPKRQRRRRQQEDDNCSALQLQNLQHSSVHQRSISPWSHKINEDENRYPSRLAFAYCLCKGCIDAKTGVETTSLNSVPVFQEMLVLRRKPCLRNSEAGSFTLEVDYIKVPVACTCVLPQTSS
ncbi:interleukin-17C [Heteronotia binoei]|uniref:interleukin-17C n=1 Tax=Heteronotia binoei TaxID=13085 RepID=UPI00292DBACC|nr:interleukin-17C [Heteronotia binoei]